MVPSNSLVPSVLNLNTVRASLVTGNFVLTWEGTGWNGNFPTGMPILWNLNNGPVTLQFSMPVSVFVTYVMVRDQL